MRRQYFFYYGLTFSLAPLLSIFLLLTLSTMNAPSRAGSPAWLDLDGPWGGPAQSLSLNPDYPTDPVVFAGGGRDFGHASWGGFGVFRSNDGGLTWPDRGGPENGALFDVAFSPDWQNDGYALAAFWLGLWSTTDRGASWRQLSSLETGGPLGITAVAVGPVIEGSRVLLAGGAYGGIWRAVGDGAPWTFLGQVSSVSAIAFQPTNMQIALAGASDGVWRSTDAGLTWTRVTTPTQVYDLAFRPGGSEAYATFDSRIWRSDDGGLSWQPFTDLTASFLNPIGVSADGAGLFTAAGDTLYRYDAASSSFVTVTTNLATNYILRLAPSPTYAADKTLLLSTYDGVYISRDEGATFTRSHGFYKLPVADLQTAPDYVAGGDLFATGAFGIWRWQSGEWRPLNKGIIGTLASSVSTLAVSPDYANDGALFAGQSSSVSIGASLYRSVDRGATWQRLVGAASILKVMLSPNFAGDHRVFMLADQRVLTSNDAGETWSLSPIWDFDNTARLLALSPNFSANQTLYAVGSNVYRSLDAGVTWQMSSSLPPAPPDSDPWWQPRHLVVAADDTLFLNMSGFEAAPPYRRREQLWMSSDQGETWSQLSAAPDRPVADMAINLTDDTIYLSTFDDNPNDEFDLPADLYRSADRGKTWQNLGAIPNDADGSQLLAPSGMSDAILVGGEGVWQFTSTLAPTATPDPCQELLANGSFEYKGVWRIPVTAYSAEYTLERHSHGSWSMRTGIVDPAANRRSYSDFSQDVTLPDLPVLSLRFQRWPQAGASAATASSADLQKILAATTLEEFQRIVETTAADLQYAMVIAPPGGTIHFLYARLDNNQAWVNEEFDLAAFRGRTVRLQFGTFNDGVGSLAAQFFDNMKLRACSATPVTPDPTPTATPSPTPTVTPIPGTTPMPANRMWLPAIQRSGGGAIPPLIGVEPSLEQATPLVRNE